MNHYSSLFGTAATTLTWVGAGIVYEPDDLPVEVWLKIREARARDDPPWMRPVTGREPIGDPPSDDEDDEDDDEDDKDDEDDE